MFHDVFSWIFFFQISQSVLSLAITIVSLTSTDLSTSVLIGKIIYLAIIFGQNALYCYLGNNILFEVNYEVNLLNSVCSTGLGFWFFSDYFSRQNSQQKLISVIS